MSNLNAEHLEDERREMDVPVGSPIIVIADSGRWDGRDTGYREIENGCLNDCLYSELDGVTSQADKFNKSLVVSTNTDRLLQSIQIVLDFGNLRVLPRLYHQYC